MKSLKRIALVTLGVLALCATLVACGGSKGGDGGHSSAAKSGIQGTKLSQAIPEPALKLTDQDGKPYDLRAQTKGKVTILYFGYTHCPDVCPATMADLAVAVKNVPAQVRSHVTVVFVTSDPARDTPPVIKSWLARFNPAFVGLTGPIDTIYAAADKVGIPMVRPKKNAHGDYEVNHGTEVLAFGPDQKAHVVYTDGTTSQTYSHDLTLLTEGQT